MKSIQVVVDEIEIQIWNIKATTGGYEGLVCGYECPTDEQSLAQIVDIFKSRGTTLTIGTVRDDSFEANASWPHPDNPEG